MGQRIDMHNSALDTVAGRTGKEATHEHAFVFSFCRQAGKHEKRKTHMLQRQTTAVVISVTPRLHGSNTSQLLDPVLAEIWLR